MKTIDRILMIALNVAISAAVAWFVSSRNATVMSAVSAENPSSTGQIDCREEIRRLCDDENNASCLSSQYASLPAVCQSDVADRLRSSIAECREEISEYCPNTPPGEGRVVNCLRRNLTKLSAACRERIEVKAPPVPPPPK